MRCWLRQSVRHAGEGDATIGGAPYRAVIIADDYGGALNLDIDEVAAASGSDAVSAGPDPTAVQSAGNITADCVSDVQVPASVATISAMVTPIAPAMVLAAQAAPLFAE